MLKGLFSQCGEQSGGQFGGQDSGQFGSQEGGQFQSGGQYGGQSGGYAETDVYTGNPQQDILKMINKRVAIPTAYGEFGLTARDFDYLNQTGEIGQTGWYNIQQWLNHPNWAVVPLEIDYMRLGSAMILSVEWEEGIDDFCEMRRPNPNAVINNYIFVSQNLKLFSCFNIDISIILPKIIKDLDEIEGLASIGGYVENYDELININYNVYDVNINENQYNQRPQASDFDF